MTILYGKYFSTHVTSETIIIIIIIIIIYSSFAPHGA
jgi:hypothetical protein